MGSGYIDIRSVPNKYFALFEDGTNSEWDSFDETYKIPDKLCIIEARPSEVYTTTSDHTIIYHSYNMLNNKRERINIQIGKTTCLSIGSEHRRYGSSCDIYPAFKDSHGNLYKVKISTDTYHYNYKFSQLISVLKTIDNFSKLELQEFNSKQVVTNWKNDPMKIDIGIYWRKDK